MILVEVDSVMMLTTGVTTTSWMLAMLSNTTVTMTDMASEFSGLAESGWLDIIKDDFINYCVGILKLEFLYI